MADERPGDAAQADMDFASWLKGLRFAVDSDELGAVRAAYHRLARMNELNRVPVSVGAEITNPGKAL